jgi:hypothetical protein
MNFALSVLDQIVRTGRRKLTIASGIFCSSRAIDHTQLSWEIIKRKFNKVVERGNLEIFKDLVSFDFIPDFPKHLAIYFVHTKFNELILITRIN